MEWRGYLVTQRLNIPNPDNWAALIALFDAMGEHESSFPAYNLHSRERLDGDAVLYESNFDTAEVTIAAFKQLLADAFGVPIEDIHSTTGSASYAGGVTVVWTFWYPEIAEGKDRFLVERFGGGGSDWQESGDECRGYLVLYRDEWDGEEL